MKIRVGLGCPVVPWIRAKCMPSFLNVARESMHGGVPHKGTALCAHMCRSFFQYTAAHGMCAVQIFVDVVGAFDTVLRQLLFCGPLSHELVAFVLRTLGIGPEGIHQLASHVSSGESLQHSGMSPSCTSFLRSVTRALGLVPREFRRFPRLRLALSRRSVGGHSV